VNAKVDVMNYDGNDAQPAQDIDTWDTILRPICGG
jgi:hypothetical protein